MIRLLASVAIAGVTLPLVSVPLPGKKLPLGAPARRAGAVEVHEVAVTGSGSRRVSLLVGRTRDNRLCVGSGAFFRCLSNDDAQPAYLLATYGGTGNGRDWGTVIGLVGPEIERVDIQHQDNLRRGAEHVVRWAGFPWRAVTVPVSGPNGRLPGAVDLYAAGGSTSVFVDLFGVASSCLANRRCSRSGRTWKVTGDSPMAPVGLTDPRLRAARHIALEGPVVRRLLGNATRVVEVATWNSCGGVFLGARIDLQLFRPIRVVGNLPFVSFGKEKHGRAYADGVVHSELSGVDHVNVNVDLRRHRVVGIDPTGTSLHVLDYHLVKRPTPEGPGDPALCPSPG